MSTIRFMSLVKPSLGRILIKPICSNKTNFKLIQNEKRSLFTTKFKQSAETTTPQTPTESEQKLIDLLRARFPKAKDIEVVDISGGCGAMYTIYVETSEFKNLRTVKQHQLINEVLKSEIKHNMHGLRIQTAVAKD